MRVVVTSGLRWRNDLNLDPIWIFTVERIVVGASGKWMVVFIKNLIAGLSDPRRDLVDLLARGRVKGQVIQTHTLAMLSRLHMLRFGLNQDYVGAVELVAHALAPVLKFPIAKETQQSFPEPL